jgi:hypothetical protein
MDKVEDKWDDLALWEFYSWLLEQSKHHEVDRSGFISEEYKSDKKRAEKSKEPVTLTGSFNGKI